MSNLRKTRTSEEPDPYSSTASQEAASREEKPSLLERAGRWLWQNIVARNADSSVREALAEILEGHEDEGSLLAPEEKAMLKNMLQLGELTVSQIMVSRSNILAVEDSVTFEELKRHVIEQGHTRIPVFHDTLDDVRGFIHVKDLVPMLSGDSPFNLSQVVREVLFIPPSLKIMDLLLRMRVSGVHIAIVVDEYGGTDGLVTLEDVFEEIVGDIQDEHDEEMLHEEVFSISDNIVEVDAKIPVERLEQFLNVPLLQEEEGEDFDTLGGLIFYQLGRIPAQGERIEHPTGVVFEVLDADPRRIKRVRIITPENITPSL